jgi:hypothetical protein
MVSIPIFTQTTRSPEARAGNSRLPLFSLFSLVCPPLYFNFGNYCGQYLSINMDNFTAVVMEDHPNVYINNTCKHQTKTDSYIQ